MEREPVQLHTVRHRCHARWQQVSGLPYSDRKFVRVGQLSNGRWYVELVGGAGGPARLYGSDTAAYTAARRVMDHYGPDWEQIPCYPTEAALPEARRRARERGQGSGSGSQV